MNSKRCKRPRKSGSQSLKEGWRKKFNFNQNQSWRFCNLRISRAFFVHLFFLWNTPFKPIKNTLNKNAWIRMHNKKISCTTFPSHLKGAASLRCSDWNVQAKGLAGRCLATQRGWVPRQWPRNIIWPIAFLPFFYPIQGIKFDLWRVFPICLRYLVAVLSNTHFFVAFSKRLLNCKGLPKIGIA